MNERDDIFLLRQDRHCGLNLSLTLLQDHFFNRFYNHGYPVILMNTRPWKFNEISYLRTNWNRIYFHFIDVNKYFYDESLGESSLTHKNKTTDSYRYMCSFFFSGFLKVPLLQEYRYLMRLDDDTCILDHINFDIFNDMQLRNVYYAFQAMFCDPNDVVLGLREYIYDYVSTYDITPANPKLIAKITAYSPLCYPSFSTNFEVIDTWRYRQADIAHFLHNITDSNLIFHRRWGDAPLRMVIAQLFWDPDEVMRLCEFDYQHSNWERNSVVMCRKRHTHDAVVNFLPIFELRTDSISYIWFEYMYTIGVRLCICMFIMLIIYKSCVRRKNND